MDICIYMYTSVVYICVCMGGLGPILTLILGANKPDSWLPVHNNCTVWNNPPSIASH